MDIRKIKKLIELVEESGIAEIEIKEGEESVRLSRYQANAPVAQHITIPEPVHAAPKAPIAESQAQETEAKPINSCCVGKKSKAKKSPALWLISNLPRGPAL